ncbi:hypothetical protein [Lentzea sp. NPDC055074]
MTIGKIRAMLGVDPAEFLSTPDAGSAPTLPAEPAAPPAETPPLNRVPQGEEEYADRRRDPWLGAPQPLQPDRNPMIGLRELWLETVADPPWAPDAVPTLPKLSDRQLMTDPPHEPLLRRASMSAVVQTLLSRRAPDDEIDVPNLVEQLASARAVRELPRTSRPTLRFGAHVLLDESEAMSLFWRDQCALVDVVRDVVGASSTRVSVLTGTPSRLEPGHRHPSPGRAVLVVGGFGIRWGRADQPSWESYVRWLRQRDCRVVALVPFSRDRWPAWLTALLPVVSWDRVTTVGGVRAALGRAA